MRMRILLFIGMLLLVACNGVIDPIVIPDPALTLSASKDTVNPGDVVTISVVATDATKTESNLENAPTTTKWSKDIVINEDFKISVSAFNAAGVKIEKSLNISVVSYKDILRSHGWKYKKKESWKISTNTFIGPYELSASELSDITFFTSDNYLNRFHNGATDPYVSNKYSLVGNVITCGDAVLTITLLNDLKLQFEQVYKYADDQVIKYYYEKAN